MFFKALAAIVTADAIDRYKREQQRLRWQSQAPSAMPPPPARAWTSPGGRLRDIDYSAPERP